MILSKTEAHDGHVRGGQVAAFFADFMALFKGIVLIANVLPVFTGFWLALVFTNTSFAIHVDLFLLTIIGSTLVMAGALVLNNWYEVDLDTVMDRTQIRPTVTGRISLKTTLALGIVLSIVGFVFLAFTTWEAVLYAFIGWFTYVIMYTMWTKRKYTLNTVIGSISGAVTPLIGWAAVGSANHIVPVVLFMILFIWQMPHTFAIAMKRHDEYKAAGVAMLPVIRGFEMTKRQIFVYVACLLPFPFFLVPLGTAFIVVATVLNLAWLGLAIWGFFVKDDMKWARINFVVSVNYIAILFIMMVIVTL
ncbi:protoheme IX farnesyltransferase [Siminovitchia acidinfaciens]|uniref:Protoheme IX farnesyltransferase n=1 Tax=Siminovitchia acidinfaciens TaxID=2321395 RepID=A0A429XW03_9BACI|nr:heme o synthase [Siminovitchia acidinfaciens]RST72529.1 protoheme IX farnesyltransferase [Siminovitchia acidinfaciens]